VAEDGALLAQALAGSARRAVGARAALRCAAFGRTGDMFMKTTTPMVTFAGRIDRPGRHRMVLAAGERHSESGRLESHINCGMAHAEACLLPFERATSSVPSLIVVARADARGLTCGGRLGGRRHAP
jgi:hypothetical protein